MNLGQIISRCRSLSGSIATSRWKQQVMADLVNNSQIQLALEVDFPEATLHGPTNPQPAAPVLAVVGTPGTQSISYFIVNVAAPPWGGGDSYPSPAAQILDAPNTLDSANHVTLVFTTVAKQRYKIIRQVAGDPFLSFLGEVTASGASTSFADNGSFAPVFYAPQRGNEFQVPELVKVLRAYMVDNLGNLQPLVPDDINVLEGVTIEEWDQSSGRVAGAPQFTPLALAQQATTYPVASPFGRVPVKTPWQNTNSGAQRPKWYPRTGYFGVLPPPSGLYMIRLDFIPKPKLLTQNGDVSDFPDDFKDAVCYKTLSDMMGGEDNSRDDNYLAKFTAECAKLRNRTRSISANSANKVIPIPIRTQMRNWSV